MKPAPFRHYTPATAEEAVALLARLAPEDGRVLAGGQSLVPTMAFCLARPAHLIDINGIAALDRLAVGDGRAVRHIAHDAMRDAMRARGMFCGSIANADPASEWCTPAMALVTFSVDGAKIVSLRIAVGGAGRVPKPHPRPGEQAALAGEAPGPAAFAAAAARATAAVQPMDDAQNTAQHRRDLVRTVARRALEQAA